MRRVLLRLVISAPGAAGIQKLFNVEKNTQPVQFLVSLIIVGNA